MSEKFISPYWYVKVTNDRKESNMIVKHLKDTHVWTVGGANVLPHLENTCQVKPGTELVLYRPQVLKPVSQPEALQDVKRRKTGKVSAP